MKFYRWLYLVSAAIILTACGGPVADAPAAVAEGDPLVESLITEAQTLGVELAVQTNSKNYRYIKVYKKVVGVNPYHPAKYNFILACKKGRGYDVVIHTDLAWKNPSKQYKIPDYYWDCFGIEYGTVGDSVHFYVRQQDPGKQWKHTYNRDAEFKHTKWGRAAVSKTIHLTKKYVEIYVTNKFNPKEESPKTVKVTFHKVLAGHYEYLDDNDKFFFGFYCNDKEVTVPNVNFFTKSQLSKTVELNYNDIKGKSCYVKEYYDDQDNDYILEKVGFTFSAYGTNSTEDAVVDSAGYSAKSLPFTVREYHSKVTVTYTNYLKYVRPDPEHVTVHVTKRFPKDYHPGVNDVVFVGVYCGGGAPENEVSPPGTQLTATNSYNVKFVIAYSKVKGKECFVREYYENKEYELVSAHFYFSSPYNGADGPGTITPAGGGYVADSETFEFHPRDPDVGVIISNGLQKKHPGPA